MINDSLALQARRAKYEQRNHDEAWHLLKAGHWNESHRALLKHVAADAIINGRLGTSLEPSITQSYFSKLLTENLELNCEHKVWSVLVSSRFDLYVNGFVQDCSNSIANALELLICFKPSIYPTSICQCHITCNVSVFLL